MPIHPNFGLTAAPHTPLHPDGTLNLDRIADQAALLARNGVAGAFICGTTGEGTSLTTDERRRVAERWSEVKGDVRLIVHVGHACSEDARALARHAQERGADAIAAIPPIYFKPPTAAALADECAYLAEAAPELPFYYYHIPSMTGVNFPMLSLLQAAAERVPNFAGIKYSHDDLVDFGQCVDEADGEFQMLFGRDEALLSALVAGADGAVGSTYNYAAPLYRELAASLRKGDLPLAREWQRKSREMVAALDRFGGVASGKAVMARIGIDCGPVRRPLRPLTREQTAALNAALDAVGFSDYCSR